MQLRGVCVTILKTFLAVLFLGILVAGVLIAWFVKNVTTKNQEISENIERLKTDFAVGKPIEGLLDAAIRTKVYKIEILVEDLTQESSDVEPPSPPPPSPNPADNRPSLNLTSEDPNTRSVAIYIDPNSKRFSEVISRKSNGLKLPPSEDQLQKVKQELARTHSGFIFLEFDGPGLSDTRLRFAFINRSVARIEHSSAPAEGY